MERWEDLYAKVQEAEAVNANIKHLVSILENDKFWLNRYEFSGTAREQMDRFEIHFNQMKESLITANRAHEIFHESYEKVKSPCYLNTASYEEQEDAYQKMEEGVNLSFRGSLNIRDGLIKIIDNFRELQGLSPLDGGLSPLN